MFFVGKLTISMTIFQFSMLVITRLGKSYENPIASPFSFGFPMVNSPLLVSPKLFLVSVPDFPETMPQADDEPMTAGPLVGARDQLCHVVEPARGSSGFDQGGDPENLVQKAGLLVVITCYNWCFQWDYMIYKCGNSSVLITGIERAITVVNSTQIISYHPSLTDVFLETFGLNTVELNTNNSKTTLM